MALTDRLMVVVDAHTGGAVREMRKVEAATQRVGAEAKKTGGIFDKLGGQFGVSGATLKAGLAAGAVAAGAALVKFGADGVRAASDLEQSVGAVESVFGSASGAVFKFGETAAQSAGLSKREVNAMAAVVGAQLQGMGLSAGESAKQVVILQKRAADMAATFGGSTKDALEAISATLRGERDPIEKYGVSLKDVDVKARIAALGLDTSTLAAQKQATAVASLDLVMSGTVKTQGQFGRESDTLAGQQARLEAQMENLKATVGEGLTPALADLAEAVNDTIGPIDSLLKKSNELGFTQKAAAVLVSPLGFAYRTVKEQIENVREAFGGASAETDKNTASLVRNKAEVNKMAATEAELAEQLEKEMDAADKLSASLFGTENAKRALAAATRAEADAEEDLTEKRKELNELLKRGAVDAKAVAAAEREVASATRTVASAQERVVAAEEALRKARGYDPADLAEADLDRRDAQLGVADAVDRVQSAQEALNQAQQEGDPEAVDDATRDLAQAHIGLERAQRAATAAQRAQNDINPNSEAGAKRVKEAERELWRATEDQTTASQGLWDATVKLNEARAGDPGFLADVAEKTRAVKDAEQNVADAKWNHLQQAIALHGAIEKENELLSETGKRIDIVRWKLAELANANPQFSGAINGIAGRVVGESAPPFDMAGGGNWNGSPMNVTVQVTSMNPNDVIAAIKKYEYANGPGWRRV